MKKTYILTCLLFIFISISCAEDEKDYNGPSDAQFWNFEVKDRENETIGKLHNKNGDWIYMNKTWNISDFPIQGYIEDISTGQVLTLKYGLEENGTEVILAAKNDPITEDQKWERKWFEEIWNKYTMLVHVNSGKFLTRDGKNRIIITDFEWPQKDDGWGHPILPYLSGIIHGIIWGLIIIILATVWIYCLCCRKKGKMTQAQKDEEMKKR